MWRIKHIKIARIICLLIPLWGFGGCLSAQKNDYHWLHGYDSFAGAKNDTNVWGINHLDFNIAPFSLTRDSLKMNFDFTNTTYSDDTGALLFYTNGIYIANEWGEKIENSDSMNAGYVSYVYDPSIAKGGYRTPQGIIALQQPDSPHIFHLVHCFSDTFGLFNNIYGFKILETILDMKANNHHGKVIKKNVPILVGEFGNALKAVKHSNGKDWWIVVQDNPNNFTKLLLTSQGMSKDTFTQDFNLKIKIGDIGVACFSSDGSKYVYLSAYKGLEIFDFNRCTGELSNLDTIPLPIISDSNWIGIGVEISPNNRYLYVSMTNRIYQYDLQAIDIAASTIQVAQYDGFREDGFLPTILCTQQLAPDGKIYISTGNGTRRYHVIEYPDSAGLSCQVRQHGIKLKAYCNGIPNFPNYRLGAKVCTNSIIEPLATTAIKLYPNPTQGQCIIDYGSIVWEQSLEVQLQVVDILGKEIYHTQLPQYSGIHAIDMTPYSSGVYIINLQQGGQQIWRGKLVRE